ncbi:MAG: ABC transporter substrate-binding protein [Thauera sp.]|nr:ABC transporter substrate-binding protein [Thauera sp.]
MPFTGRSLRTPVCLRRRGFLGTLAAFGLGTVLGCRPDAPLTVAAHVWPGYELMFLARDQAWLDTARLRFLRTASATESIEALRTRRVSAAALTLDEVLRVRSEGIPLTVVLVFDISSGADVVLAKDSIDSLAALRGKRIGVEDSAVGSLMLHKLEEAAGLQEKEFIAVSLRIDEHVAAWNSGGLDAIVSYEPTATLLEHAGARRIFDSRRFPPAIIDVLAIRTEALNRHTEDLRILAAGHFRALRHFNTHRIDAIHRLGSSMKLDAESVTEVYRGLELPDLDRNRHLLRGVPPPLLQTAAELSDLLTRHDLLLRRDSLDKLVADVGLPTGING